MGKEKSGGKRFRERGGENKLGEMVCRAASLPEV
jgi:hypothetical protein